MAYSTYIFAALGAMTLATFFTRVLPFLFLYRFRDSPHLAYLGKYLPACAATALLIYCLKDNWAQFSFMTLAELLGVIVTAVIYLWRKSALQAICIGTGSYMALLQFYA